MVAGREPATDGDDRTDADSAASQENDTNDDQWLISCHCLSARPISTLLSCLEHVASRGGESHALKDVGASQSRYRRTSGSTAAPQPVTVFCSPERLTFHVFGKAKQSQASVDVQADLFTEYQCFHMGNEQEGSKPGGEFCVNLSTVLECLHVLGTQSLDRTKLSFTYNLSKEIFQMELLEESGILSTAAIPGMLPPDDDVGSSLALGFRSSPIEARIIVKSETLREVIPELELVGGATCGNVSLGPEGLKLSAVGHTGECLIVLPANGSHIVSLEIQDNKPATRTYPLHSLLSSMRALDIAEETCISMNGNGMMAIQHQVLDPLAEDKPNFVDFIMCCLEEDDEDDTTRLSHSQESRSISLGWSKTGSQVSQSTDGQIFGTDETDEDHDGGSPAISSAPLFGTVVRDDASGGRPLSSSRAVRRRRRNRSFSDDEESDHSRNLLADDSDEDEKELDVTVEVSPSRRDRTRADECSSPEVVYGHR